MNMKYTAAQLTGLVLLRIIVGWHLLYEGLSKLIDPYWTSAGYLSESKWIFASLLRSLARNPHVLAGVDFVNIWSLIIIGTFLIAGLFTRVVSYSGMILLLLYYIAYPPLVGIESPFAAGGRHLLINWTIIEAAALFVLALFPTGGMIGVDRLIFRHGRPSE
ncbi:MAG: DoxX family membrane protein [Fidelibacterota bacterium]|nr:MAG: DoxX family membrane protein [Candidatus Neomarinimicrobiota bacterium]